MRRKKKLPMIEVKTVQNGYVLTFDGARHEFMYFSPDKLLEGFMMHIGLKMTEQLNMENVTDFLATAMNWSDAEKRIKEIDLLKTALSSMTSKRNGLARQMRDERARYINIYNDLTIIRDAAKPSTDDMLRELTETIMKRHREQKPITAASQGITSDDVITDEDEASEEDNQ